MYAGSPSKATAIEASGQQTAEEAFISVMRLAAVSTKPLILAQQALAAAAQPSSQQQQLPLLWPDQQLQSTVAQLAERPLRELFTQHSSSSSSGSDKQSRAAALTAIQHELLRDLQRMGLLPEAGKSGAAAAATSGGGGGGGGMVSREDVLRAFDTLQSRLMRDVLLSDEVRRAVKHRVQGFVSLTVICCS
jgi:polyribonucleotide nucleotidyltransferase